MLVSGFSAFPDSFPTGFPVIAKNENLGVSAVKYRYLLSSLNRVTGSYDHFLSLYLFKVMEAWIDLLILHPGLFNLETNDGISYIA